MAEYQKLSVTFILMIMSLYFFSSIFKDTHSKENDQYYRIKNIVKALFFYYEQNDKFPISLDILGKYDKNIQGKYINKFLINTDNWGSNYIYKYPVEYKKKRFILCSSGKNKIYDKGKSDDICDNSNHWNKI